MKTQRILIALTVINLGLAMFLLAQIRRVDARSTEARGFEADSVAPVLRGRELEIVDDHGRVRASIKIHPADTKFKMPDGKIGYPERVRFRLIDPKGRPEVKLGASVQGGGLGLVGETDSTHLVLEAEGSDSSLKMTNKDASAANQAVEMICATSTVERLEELYQKCEREYKESFAKIAEG